jgi:hypothetical protein
MVCQTRVTIERQMPSLYSWRMEKLIVTIMYCSIPNDEQMDQRTLSALSYLSRGYDMVQVYNKMSDYNDKSYGLLISQVGIQYTKHLRYISMLITENAAGGIKED